MKHVVEWVVHAILRAVPLKSERWYWFREAVTFLPGGLGTVVRRTFYNAYFHRPGADITVVAGAYIEDPQCIDCGDRATFGRNSWISAGGGLRIGNDVGIGPGVIIHTANHNYLDANKPFFQQGHTLKPVEIEDDVWLAAGVIIVPGTRIGRGAVISAGSVISGSIEPFSLMVGFPARRIGVRGSGGSPNGLSDGTNATS